MREILFRGRRIDNGKWTEGYYAVIGRRAVIIELPQMYYDENGGERYGNELHDVDKETVCQYTGLKDRNGSRIFQGDIVKCGSNLVVTWSEKAAGWCLTKEGWLYNHYFGEACSPGDCEVIGNIFDNPEMLENKEV